MNSSVCSCRNLASAAGSSDRQRAAIAVALVVLAQVVAYRLLGGHLHGQIQAGVDFQPAAVEQLAAIGRLQVAAHLFGEVGGRVHVLVRRERMEQRRLEGGVGLGLGDVFFLDHAAEHVLLPVLGRLQIVVRRIATGGLRKSGEQAHSARFSCSTFLSK